MFSPERFGSQRTSFGVTEAPTGRNFIGLKTAFRPKDSRTPLQKAAHFRFSEPATPSVQSGRGWRPSDLTDPHKREFLTELTGRIFHLAASGDNEDGERKISLERLFTPATDSGDLTPKRSPSKKAFASSSFYRPDHPTIDDQVELAQRISFSLVDENNKMSRGQSMYMKRKKRSMRWIHAGGAHDEDAAGSAEGGEGPEEDLLLKQPPMKPPMKLLMSPKGVQDFHAVQEHYQTLMEQAVPTSPEVGKIVAEVQSPTGKGAELFAKRKKRMDKFIVDETTVQKAQTTTRTPQPQPQPVVTDDLNMKKSAVEQRNRQQQQIMLANTVVERADTKLAESSWLEPPKPMPLMTPQVTPQVAPAPAAAPSGSFTLPDLTKILTQPSKPKSSEPTLEPNKPKPVPPKPKAWHSVNRAGSDDSPTPALRGGSQRTPASPALTSATCSPKPLPLPPPPRTYTSPQSFSSVLKPSCKVNKSQAVTQSDDSRSVVSPKSAAVAPPVAPRPASASTTASGVSGRFPARPVAFPKPVPATASGMKHFVVPSSRASVDSTIQDRTKFHSTSSSNPSVTPSSASPIPKHINDSSSPASNALASVPAVVCGGGANGAFKTSHTSVSVRPNSVPAYLPASPSSPIPPPPRSIPSINTPPPVLPRKSWAKEQVQLKPGTPPLYVFPDETEASYLNENAVNHRTESCILEAPGEAFQPPAGGKNSSAVIEILTHDCAIASSHLEKNTEVSRHTEGTAHSTRIDTLSTQHSENTSTSTHHLESHVQNSTINSIHSSSSSSSRPARPTSLPLISLSSLVNSSSLASPASLPCNSATSPLLSAAYPGARSFSDVALMPNPFDSDTSLPCVVSADPCVVSQVGGASVLTPASPLPGPLPDLSSTPSQALVFTGPTSRSTGAPDPREDEHKLPPIEMNTQNVHQERFTKSQPEGQMLHSGPTPRSFCSESFHVTQVKELELQVATAEESTSAADKDATNKTNYVSTQPHEKDYSRINAQPDLDNNLMEASLSSFSLGIPLIEISNEPRKPSLEEEELRKYMEEIKSTFQNAPTLIDTIDVQDLKPPEYYRSVSRDSMDQELMDAHTIAASDPVVETSRDTLVGGGDLSHADPQHEVIPVFDTSDGKAIQDHSCVGASDTADKDTGHPGKEEGPRDARVAQTEALTEDAGNGGDDVHSGMDERDGEGRGQADEESRPRYGFRNCMVFTRRCYSPTNESPSPPLSPPPTSTNPPTPSAGPAAIYSAEVKVVMRSSQPPTPAMDVPRAVFSPMDSNNKRNSASFNMAAKGWGTYNNFYSPITFAT